jgi:hypothetical protein
MNLESASKLGLRRRRDCDHERFCTRIGGDAEQRTRVRAVRISKLSERLDLSKKILDYSQSLGFRSRVVSK